jgi:hypothetical protein
MLNPLFLHLSTHLLTFLTLLILNSLIKCNFYFQEISRLFFSTFSFTPLLEFSKGRQLRKKGARQKSQTKKVDFEKRRREFLKKLN